MHAHELSQDLNDTTGPDATGHIDRQALSRPFVDDRETLQLLRIRTRIEHEVVRPHVIRPGGRHRSGPPGRDSAPRATSRYLQRRLTPEPMRAIRTHHMARAREEDPNPPIAVARVLTRQLAHRRDRGRIPGRQPRL